MRRILISEADGAMYEAVKETLQHSYKVSPLGKTEKLQEYLVQNNVEMILLTVSEENTEGFLIYEQITAFPELHGKPVIFLTGKSNTWIEGKVLELGAQYYIVMPATAAMLYNRIENIFELHTLRQNKQYVEKYQDAISISFAELVDCRDETTGGHLKNTTRYFRILLEEAIANDYHKDLLALEDVRDLLRSATLHDIGKIGISDEILHKTSPLDYHEYENMKTHTTLGKEAFEHIIRETGGTRWLYLAKDMAYCHHERWDGKGYPNGLAGEQIPVYARILAVADVYDALTQARPYKEAFTHQQAVELIVKEKGRMFEPQLVDLFVNASKRFEEALLINSRNDIEKE